ncbi:DUF1643 domain-containing protein [Cytobacillus sp. Hz8]|uniref:DUF1643 domain-containing protein n=1 Tax=Cytobacillus sp. Hz8 TaxID=3347168 RepID=UPI0035E26C74
MKTVYFSNFIDEESITMNPKFFDSSEKKLHRFSITIPFHNRIDGEHAIVILKNPSNAGKEDTQGRKVSDDTIYKITDYLFKLGNVQKVTIVNLFTMVSGTPDYLKDYIGTDDELRYRTYNNEVILQLLSNFNVEKDIIIAAWGNNKPLLESKYKERIREVIKLIGDKPLYRVGPMVNNNNYPGHGRYWYDYEDISPYPSNAVR